MSVQSTYQRDFNKNGFAVIENVFSEAEIRTLIDTIEQADTSRPTFRKGTTLFAIRQLLKEVPEAIQLIFTNQFRDIINSLSDHPCFVVKSIYFDKPGNSNWFVSYHQDLTISVDKKITMEGFGSWTKKENQFAVQPPLHILQNNFTAHIHLDDTDEYNGALRVIPKSHKKGVYRPGSSEWFKEGEVTCNVQRGGIMLMQPLLLHASNRTTNGRRRRVIHIEFSTQILPNPLKWSEMIEINF
jgi:hypothetical protein